MERLRYSLWQWPSLLSLDAVLIGLLWQGLFCQVFLGRWPVWYEASIIGLTIWLVYTFDRLWDGRRIDLSRPHSIRHRFHQRLQNPITALALIGLSIDVALVVTMANARELLVGGILAVLVVCYLVIVHRLRERWTHFPKEFAAGGIFALGVSLVVWADPPDSAMIPLCCSTILAATLFATNCLLVADAEREMDRVQGFPSFAQRRGSLRRAAIGILGVQMLVAASLGAMEQLPWMMAVCLISAAMLMMVAVWLGMPVNFDRVRNIRYSRNRAAIVDGALCVPVLLWCLLA